MLRMRTVTPAVFAESLREGPPSPHRTDLLTLPVLEPSGSQWAIKVPDGRVIPTGAGQERTERDVEWENNHQHGRGGCSAVVRDAYKTPWRRAEDPAPVVAADPEVAMTLADELAALHAQVAHLGDLVHHYRRLAHPQSSCV